MIRSHKTVRGGYDNVVIDLGIDRNIFKSRSAICQRVHVFNLCL